MCKRLTTIPSVSLLDISSQPLADAALAEQLTYTGLGLAGASFAGTFFVIPRFKESFKEDVAWQDIYKYLKQDGGVKGISAPQAAAARGWVVGVGGVEASSASSVPNQHYRWVLP